MKGDKTSEIKRAVIAGASEALKMKAGNYKNKDDEIIQNITKRMDEILEKID